MSDIRRGALDDRWARAVLKSSWYDAEEGQHAATVEQVENSLRASTLHFIPRDEERISSSEVERFFDVLGTMSEH